MKLYSKPFEKALRRGVKKAIRASPELKREFKRVNRRSSRRWMAWLVIALFLAFPVMVCFSTAVSTTAAAAPLAALTVMSLFVIAVSAPNLAAGFVGGRNVWRFFLLPIEEEEIIRWLLKRFVRGHWLMLAFFLVSLGAIARALSFSFWQCVAVIPVAAVACVAHLTLIIHGAARLPRVFWSYLFSGGFLCFVGFVILCQWQSHATAAFLFHHAGVLNLLLPTGWALSLFQLLTPQRDWLDLAFLAPLAFLLATAPASLRVLRQRFGFREFVAPAPVNLPLRANAANATNSESASSQPPLGQTEIAEAILSRQFLAPPPDLGPGLLERFYWRLLNGRERVLTEFVFVHGLNLAKWWRRAWFLLLLTGATATLAARHYNDGVAAMCLLFGFGASGVAMLVPFITNGRAFQKVWCGGGVIPTYAGLGLGYNEISRLLLKCSLAQFPALLLLSLAAALFSTWLSHAPPVFAIVFSLKFSLLGLASRFVLLTCRFSSCTNDTTKGGFKSFLIVVLVAVWILAIVTLAIIGLAFFSLVGWLLCAASALGAFLLHRAYRWCYNHAGFDLR